MLEVQPTSQREYGHWEWPIRQWRSV